MNLPRYEFCEENKSLLLDFIKKANQCKSNPYCNLTAYNNLSKVLPLNHILDKYPEDTEIIDIIDSDENEEADHVVSQNLQNCTLPLNKTVDDISVALKEILETKKYLTSIEISDLNNPNLDPARKFKQLFDDLGSEELIDLGNLFSSHNITNDVILAYVRHMITKQLALDYSMHLQNNLNEFCSKYPEILAEEISNYLLNMLESYSRITLRYIVGLPIEFKSKLLRYFVLNCKRFEENHIAILDTLIQTEIESEILNRLIELMFKTSENFSSNNVFGKFLLKIIKLEGSNITFLEKPISHIIGNHRSIWKANLQKTYEELFMQDSILMTQSLKY